VLQCNSNNTAQQKVSLNDIEGIPIIYRLTHTCSESDCSLMNGLAGPLIPNLQA
jgi:hypothetical protein